MNKLSLSFILSIVALLAAHSCFAADRGCYDSLNQCTTAMTRSLEGWAGVEFQDACEEQNTGDRGDYRFTSGGQTYFHGYESYVSCLNGLRQALNEHVVDMVMTRSCEPVAGSPFCFEYRFTL